jgi:hypothetical protein
MSPKETFAFLIFPSSDVSVDKFFPGIAKHMISKFYFLPLRLKGTKFIYFPGG